MANNVTEGAIVQHLAKLRVRRLQKDKVVPPPLRRGGVGAAVSPKAPKAPTTPFSSEETAAAPKTTRQERPQKEPRIKIEKRAATDDGSSSSSDSDKEWSASPRSKSTKKRHRKRSHKKRKLDLLDHDLEFGIEDKKDDDDGTESTESKSDDEMMAVGAEFLKFTNGEQKEEPPVVSDSEDDDQVDKSLIVKLKLGEQNLRRVRHKGTGVYHERNPEQRWVMPSPGPNGDKWGFSKDYYGPVPKSCGNAQNPGLLRGEWPLEVAMRQYEAPQAVTWANETYEPDPRLVHPARYLEKPSCEPQLRMHRKLRPIEESNPDSRLVDQQTPAYQSYVRTQRELPTYFDPSWNVAPTVHAMSPTREYQGYGFSAANEANSSVGIAAPQGSFFQHHDSNGFTATHPQIEGEMNGHHVLDVKHTGTIDDHVDRHSEVPPGKSFDVDEMLDQNIIEDTKALAWWQD